MESSQPPALGGAGKECFIVSDSGNTKPYSRFTRNQSHANNKVDILPDSDPRAKLFDPNIELFDPRIIESTYSTRVRVSWSWDEK